MLFPFGTKSHRSIGQQDKMLASMPSMRMPDEIRHQDLVPFIERSSFINSESYLYIRHLQLQARLNNRPFKDVFFHNTGIGAVTNPYPIVIGTNEELIVVITKHILGEGAYGKVFIGFNIDTSQFVAVKKYLNPDKNINKFEYEINTLNIFDAYIDHTDIVFFNMIVMKFAWGMDFSEVIQKIFISERYKLEMALKFLVQLQTNFHDKGLVHCDLKGNNVRWDPVTKCVSIIDFGSTRPVGSWRGDLTLDNFMLSCAPELYHNNIKTYASDVYSAGIVLLQLFSNIDLYNQDIYYRLKEDVKHKYLYLKSGILWSLVFKSDVLAPKSALSETQVLTYQEIQKMLQFSPHSRSRLGKAISNLAKIYVQQCINLDAIEELIEVLTAFPKLIRKKYSNIKKNKKISMLFTLLDNCNFFYVKDFCALLAQHCDFINKYRKFRIYDLIFSYAVYSNMLPSVHFLLNNHIITDLMRDAAIKYAKKSNHVAMLSLLQNPTTFAIEQKDADSKEQEITPAQDSDIVQKALPQPMPKLESMALPKAAPISSSELFFLEDAFKNLDISNLKTKAFTPLYYKSMARSVPSQPAFSVLAQDLLPKNEPKYTVFEQSLKRKTLEKTYNKRAPSKPQAHRKDMPANRKRQAKPY